MDNVNNTNVSNNLAQQPHNTWGNEDIQEAKIAAGVLGSNAFLQLVEDNPQLRSQFGISANGAPEIIKPGADANRDDRIDSFAGTDFMADFAKIAILFLEAVREERDVAREGRTTERQSMKAEGEKAISSMRDKAIMDFMTSMISVGVTVAGSGISMYGSAKSLRGLSQNAKAAKGTDGLDVRAVEVKPTTNTKSTNGVNAPQPNSTKGVTPNSATSGSRSNTKADMDPNAPANVDAKTKAETKADAKADAENDIKIDAKTDVKTQKVMSEAEANAISTKYRAIGDLVKTMGDMVGASLKFVSVEFEEDQKRAEIQQGLHSSLADDRNSEFRDFVGIISDVMGLIKDVNSAKNQTNSEVINHI